ncbi:MAG: GNAT family N-acetyltransferase [Caldilineaceae bacterium]
MESIKLLNQAITHIENYLTAPVSIKEAAAVAGYSRYHFSRTFLAVTGITPVAYLRKRRLTEAARELITTTRRILDIALDYQFQSQEAFTRSFKQEFGISPALYRRRRQQRRLFSKITIAASHLLYPGKGLALAPPLLRPARIATRPLRLLYIQPEDRADPTQTAATVKLNPIKIRPAHRQDLPALCRLYHVLHQFGFGGIRQRLQSSSDSECFDAAWSSLTLEKRIDAVTIAIWVAEMYGQVVGLAEVSLHKVENEQTHLSNCYGCVQSLVVDPAWRGRGIGQQLLDAAERWSRMQGATELRFNLEYG